jgi:Zn-finger nucleic acid-binding protein
MEFEEGIVVVCPFCGLVFVSSWEDADDYFECPSCRSVLAIGDGSEKLKLGEKLKARAARCRKKILEEERETAERKMGMKPETKAWIKDNFVHLAREHRARCRKRDCGVHLSSLLVALNRLGIKVPKEEVEAFL